MPVHPDATSVSSPKPHIGGTATLPQSRENREVLPSAPIHGGPVARQDRPAAKPWAHFVAGGYESIDTGLFSPLIFFFQVWWNDICNSYLPS